MDSSAVSHLPVGPFFWFAIFGVVCAAAITLGIFGGFLWLCAQILLACL